MQTKTEKLIRVLSGYFTAGLVLKGTTVVRTAPILHYMEFWEAEQVEQYAKSKGWRVEVVV